MVAPVRERGLKYHGTTRCRLNCSRSRKGAWIEITSLFVCTTAPGVAPVRERGLKLNVYLPLPLIKLVAPVRERGLKLPASADIFSWFLRRSRKGAWIEIHVDIDAGDAGRSLP